MREYIDTIFIGGTDMGQERKACFGQLCQEPLGCGREWFSRLICAQRCISKCVSEQTFYRLVQSFAVVLFECNALEDFVPAKNLMTMCFTFYHVGRPATAVDGADRGRRRGWRPPPPTPPGIVGSSWPKWGDKGGGGGGGSRTLSRESFMEMLGLEGRSKTPAKTVRNGNVERVPVEAAREQGIKIYLYTHLKQQPIW
uniref:Uncharacterized protein KIAA0513 homolog n=1 Tax=Petromyzon marinus TaxID=7757 RepID=A0AAJ7UHJ6_PETMA|nr:uncharacterized protein KIAA0513 homolog [Petromyzon marinus]